MPNKREILTVYYFRKGIVKQNRALHADAAVLHCIDHMQRNTYEATAAEVFNDSDGTLHAVIRRTMSGIEILYSDKSTPDLLSFYLKKKGQK